MSETAASNVLQFAKPTKRVRDKDYMARVRRLQCCAKSLGTCAGAMEADHAARNHGSNRKGDDTACIPMCSWHHQQRHSWAGPFRDWTGAQMRSWCLQQVEKTQARLGV